MERSDRGLLADGSSLSEADRREQFEYKGWNVYMGIFIHHYSCIYGEKNESESNADIK